MDEDNLWKYGVVKPFVKKVETKTNYKIKTEESERPKIPWASEAMEKMKTEPRAKEVSPLLKQWLIDRDIKI